MHWYNKEEEIKQIVIDCDSCNRVQLKNALVKIFGNPVVASQGCIGGIDHESFIFTISGFDIRLSGIDGSIRFYYPETIEYWREFIEKWEGE
ncbi:MAG: hypothetical protein J7539_17085 [Niabella sp.]|nr:hypothetical protein [Niabella sp.]